MLFSLFSSILSALVVSASPTAHLLFNVKPIPSTAVTGPVKADFISTPNGLDAPKLSAINSSSWDWWYFDAVSSDLKSSIVIIFYTASATGFPFLDLSDDVTVFSVHASFPNGTLFDRYIYASEVVMTTVKDGTSGSYGGTGAAWFGAPDLSQYVISINSPTNGIIGTFTLKSKVPAHYPCGPVKKGENMEVGPNIGWSNAIPDAIGTVDFKIDGSHLTFTGVGYHDKNWSDQPFTDNVDSWFWGHGRVGEYSIVWFDFIGTDGKNYISAYVAKDDKIVTATCDKGSVKVRPSGVNSTYPPNISSGNPEGFTVDLDVGSGSNLHVNVTAVQIILDGAPFYTRWVGSLVGRLNGGKALKGVALFEEFKLVE